MAEPDTIFLNGAYMNTNEDQMYIGVYRYRMHCSTRWYRTSHVDTG